MNKGNVEQIGAPVEIYDHPATAFVMSFIGPVNILPSTSHIFQKHSFAFAHTEMFLRPQDVIVEKFPTATCPITGGASDSFRLGNSGRIILR